MASEIGRSKGGCDLGMGRFSRKATANDKGGPEGFFVEKCAESFEEKGEILMIGVPAADVDDLILYGDCEVSGPEEPVVAATEVSEKEDFQKICNAEKSKKKQKFTFMNAQLHALRKKI